MGFGKWGGLTVAPLVLLGIDGWIANANDASGSPAYAAKRVRSIS